MSLIPTERSGVSRSLSDFTILIYGSPKIGKSSFCAKFPKALFIDLNSGLNGFDIYKTPVVTSWSQMLEIYKELKEPENRNKFDWIIFDTFPELYDLCLPAVTKATTGCSHPADVNNGRGDCGKTWKEITKRITNLIKGLASLGYGRILIAHVKEKETDFQTKITTEYHKPNLGTGVGNSMASMSNMILYFRNEMMDSGQPPNIIRKNFRVIRTKSSSKYLAGCQEINGKILPDPLPLDYEKFMGAFNELIK